jgi:hypothetical protein
MRGSLPSEKSAGPLLGQVVLQHNASLAFYRANCFLTQASHSPEGRP